jgi:hypothetical protein
LFTVIDAISILGSIDVTVSANDQSAWYWTCEGQIELSNRNKTAYLTDIYQLLTYSNNDKSGNRSAIGNLPLSSIAPRQWSIKIDNMKPGGWVGIGVGPKTCISQSFTGSERMWMCSANSDTWPQRMQGFDFGPGDTISVNLEDQKLHFKKNGSSTGKFLEGFITEFGADKVLLYILVY